MKKNRTYLLKIKSIDIIFFLFGLFPILPFNLKAFPLILALLISIFSFIKKRKVIFSKLYIYNSLLFILYFISLIYSEDQVYALKRLETSISIIILPIFFILISSIDTKKIDFSIVEKVFFTTFYLSVILMCIVIYIYIYSIGYFDNAVSYSFSLSYIEHRLWVFNDHPIYISIYMGISLIFSIKLYFLASKKKKILFLIGNLLILSSMIFLSRKGVIISVIVSLIYIILKMLKPSKASLIYLASCFICIIFFYFFSSSHSKRILEVFKHETYSRSMNENMSSTSIRFAIYNCAIKKIPEAGFFGFGIGDVKDVLKNCYQDTSSLLVKKEFNTHNQYFNTWLALGVLGIIFFLFFLFKLFSLSIANCDYVFVSVLIFYSIAMLTENILDRQNGVILFSVLINFFTFKNVLTKK